MIPWYTITVLAWKVRYISHLIIVRCMIAGCSPQCHDRFPDIWEQEISSLGRQYEADPSCTLHHYERSYALCRCRCCCLQWLHGDYLSSFCLPSMHKLISIILEVETLYIEFSFPCGMPCYFSSQNLWGNEFCLGQYALGAWMNEMHFLLEACIQI